MSCRVASPSSYVGDSMNTNLVWTIVGVLAAIALIIFIVSNVNLGGR